MTRIEEDLFGIREVSKDTYWDVYMLRVIENYRTSGRTINEAPELIRAFAQVKKAHTLANIQLKAMKLAKAEAIIAACDEIIENDRYMDQFPIDQFQGDAGTSVNMNTNEVITNLAPGILGEEKGHYDTINPSDHVSRSQSTNDAYPTMLRVALWRKVNRLRKVIDELADSFDEKGTEFRHILTIDHAQLQDAVPMSLDSEFSTFTHTLREEDKHLVNNAELLLGANPSATAIDTGLNTPDGYQQVIVCHPRRITGARAVGSPNLLEATSDTDAYMSIHATTKHSVVKLSKTCNDLHLLASGPRIGFNEINLPKMVADSSIMPTKVNPVIPEIADQVCLKVIDNGQTVTVAVEAGQLQLNATEPVTVQAPIEFINLPVDACDTLCERCITDIAASAEVYRDCVEDSIGITTYFNDAIGHHLGDVMGKYAVVEGKTAREVIHDTELPSEGEVKCILSPDSPVNPRYADTEGD